MTSAAAVIRRAVDTVDAQYEERLGSPNLATLRAGLPAFAESK